MPNDKTIIALSLIMTTFPAHALYKCTDNGKTQYQASPCPNEGGQQIIKAEMAWQYEKTFSPNPSVIISDVDINTKPMTNPQFGTVAYDILIAATVTNKSDKEISLYLIYKATDKDGISLVTPIILKTDNLKPKVKTTMTGKTTYFETNLNKIKKWENEEFSCQGCN